MKNLLYKAFVTVVLSLGLALPAMAEQDPTSAPCSQQRTQEECEGANCSWSDASGCAATESIFVHGEAETAETTSTTSDAYPGTNIDPVNGGGGGSPSRDMPLDPGRYDQINYTKKYDACCTAYDLQDGQMSLTGSSCPTEICTAYADCMITGDYREVHCVSISACNEQYSYLVETNTFNNRVNSTINAIFNSVGAKNISTEYDDAVEDYCNCLENFSMYLSENSRYCAN